MLAKMQKFKVDASWRCRNSDLSCTMANFKAELSITVTSVEALKSDRAVEKKILASSNVVTLEPMAGSATRTQFSCSTTSGSNASGVFAVTSSMAAHDKRAGQDILAIRAMLFARVQEQRNSANTAEFSDSGIFFASLVGCLGGC